MFLLFAMRMGGYGRRPASPQPRCSSASIARDGSRGRTYHMMSPRGTKSRRRKQHLAPPGVWRPATLDRPPHGWQPVDAGPGRRTLLLIDRVGLRSGISVMKGVTRRQFLRRTGEVGAVLGLGAARVLYPTPAHALQGYACNVCVNPGQTDHFGGGCGPSEECDPIECDGTGGGSCNVGHQCAGSGVKVKGQVWGTGDCGSGDGGAWDECCPNGLFRCRDCCGCKVHPGSPCGGSGCADDDRHYKCICRRKVADNCTVVGGNPGC